MRVFEPTMMEQIDAFLRLLVPPSHNQSPVNMTERLKRLGMDTISLLAFGYPLNTQTNPEYRFLLDAHIFGSFRSNLFLQFPLLHTLRIYNFLEMIFAKEVARYFTAMENMIATRVAEGKHARHDLYSILADEMSSEGGISSEIWSEAGFFFPAGGESTSTLLAAAFFYLSRNPKSYAKLADEVRTTFGTGSEIQGGPKLSGCKYIRACLDETMRMSPPAPGTLWRELSTTDTSPEPWVVDGQVIPPGVQVRVDTYTIHHNADFFPEPFTFKPERWTDPNIPEAQMKIMHEAFQPFSIGTRSCAGKAMAYLQASLVLAKAIWYFDFGVAPGELDTLGGGNPRLVKGRERKDEFQLYEILAATHDGPSLVFRARGDLVQDLVKGGR